MENQNDQAFEADQDVNTYENLRSRSAHLSHQGHDTVKAAFGAFERQEDADNDRTPLLGRNGSGERGDSAKRDNGEDDGGGHPQWDGERDFEGRPWWNMPSVRAYKLRCERCVLIDVIGLLAPPALLPLHCGIRRCHCPPAQLDSLPHLP